MKDFQDESLQRFHDKMLDIGVKIDIAGKRKGTATGMLGSRIDIDYSLLQVDPALYKAVFFVGGTGAEDLWNDALAKSLAQTFHFTQKLIMACNSAPVILANAGILKDRKATCASEYKQHLIDLGCDYKTDNLILDEKVLTGQGSPICDEFVKAAVSLITEES